MQSFNYTYEDFLFFGGYPGAAVIRDDANRWTDYLRSSIIDATIENDVLEMEDVRKPALMKALFDLGATLFRPRAILPQDPR